MAADGPHPPPHTEPLHHHDSMCLRIMWYTDITVFQPLPERPFRQEKPYGPICDRMKPPTSVPGAFMAPPLAPGHTLPPTPEPGGPGAIVRRPRVPRWDTRKRVARERGAVAVPIQTLPPTPEPGGGPGPPLGGPGSPRWCTRKGLEWHQKQSRDQSNCLGLKQMAAAPGPRH